MDGGRDVGAEVASETGAGLADPLTEDGRFVVQPRAVPPESAMRLAGVTAGTTRRIQVASTIFAGTTRTVTVYTPAGYVPNTPVAFMVFQDGEGAYMNNFRMPVVLDNLFFQKKVPMIVSIFIPPSGARSVEYDTVTDRYARFLTTEVLPAVEQQLDIKLSTDPDAAGIGGHSSGGIAAFTVAWFMTDRFKRVYSDSGSFTNLQTPGGDLYDDLIRNTTPAKPIRVAMTAGTNDLGDGRWTQANETMGMALMAAGYRHRYLLIQGGTHAQSFPVPFAPELMTWLWRGFPVTGPTR